MVYVKVVMSEIILKAPTSRAINPVTFEPVLIGGSPLLNLTPNSFGLTEEVTQWLDDTMPGKWRFEYDGNHYKVHFDRDEHRTLFLLKWS